MVGQTISHYRIVEKLGEGGIGVVYKAEDIRLDRTVALKFLAPHLVQDPEVRKRFEREAKVAAALDHPNISTVHEIDEADGRTFIAMAFVEGETLEARIGRGPLPLPEVLDIAIQLATGLQSAHDKGIVHRDIKPANVMLGPEGRVTIMDFGLARLLEGSLLTNEGSTLGTVAYMSPEQAQALATDGRTDIWALGVVLYEMIAGRRPFPGEYDQALVYGIVNEEPEPLTALRTGVPLELEWIAGKMLAKDPSERYQHADETIVDLRGVGKRLASGKSQVMVSPPATTSETSRGKGEQRNARRHRIIELAFAVLLVSAIGLSLTLWLGGGESTELVPLRKFSFPAEDAFAAAVSPDGHYIAYLKGRTLPRQLVIQDLREEQPRVIDGARGAGLFWAPGSDFVGFWVPQGLHKVSIHGGPVTTLWRDLPTPFLGASWSPDGDSIVLTSGMPAVYAVPSHGGEPTALFQRDELESGSSRLESPSFLPAEATAPSLLTSGGPQARLTVVDLNSGQRKELTLGERPVYSPSGHIVYESAGGLWALPFSIQTLEPLGEAFPIRERGSRPSVSRDGTLVFLDSAQGLEQLIWRDRAGRKIGQIGQPQQTILVPVLSPDGARVVARGDEAGIWDVWLHEVRRPVKTRLTLTNASEDRPIWTAEGDRVSYTRAGDIFIQASDGGGEEQVLLDGPGLDFGYKWSADGRFLVGSGQGDVWYLRTTKQGNGYEKVSFLDSPADEVAPDLSPDGRFLAYQSDESGRAEVYVQPFPDGGRKWQVSANGGTQPRWRHDGKEFFYVEGETLMAVEVITTPAFSMGVTQKLFSDKRAFASRGQQYDVSSDGQRFVVVEALEEPPPPVIRVVQNWYAEFRDRGQN